MQSLQRTSRAAGFVQAGVECCQRLRTCLPQVLTAKNGIDLGQCPNKLKQEFFEQYKNDPEMQRVDAFLCNHACSMCEVFMPFNKSLIVIASTRQAGRFVLPQPLDPLPGFNPATMWHTGCVCVPLLATNQQPCMQALRTAQHA